jgi:hypothetical protein
MPDSDGNSVSLHYKSGVTGRIEAGTKTVLLTGNKTLDSYDVISSGIDYDVDKEKLYSRYYLNFRDNLASGEMIEIHSFTEPRFDLHLTPEKDRQVVLSDKIRLYHYGAFNQASGDKTFGSPHEYDYSIITSGGEFYLEGFSKNQHNLVYDLVNTGSICIDFSGLWGYACSDGNFFTKATCEGNGKTWGASSPIDTDKHIRINVGPGNSPRWYPEDSQFIETGKETITITGVSGANGFVNVYDRDVYLNGQKLIDGKGYHTGIHTGLGYTGSAIILHSGLPGWLYTQTETQEIDGTNYAIPSDVYAPEICFVPKNTGEIPDVQVKTIKIPLGTTIPGILDPLSGNSELIWLNGLRQQRDTDYRKGYQCSLTKSFTFFEESPLIFYNNEANIWNIE